MTSSNVCFSFVDRFKAVWIASFRCNASFAIHLLHTLSLPANYHPIARTTAILIYDDRGQRRKGPLRNSSPRNILISNVRFVRQLRHHNGEQRQMGSTYSAMCAACCMRRELGESRRTRSITVDQSYTFAVVNTACVTTLCIGPRKKMLKTRSATLREKAHVAA